MTSPRLGFFSMNGLSSSPPPFLLFQKLLVQFYPISPYSCLLSLLCLCICLIGLAQFQFNIICKLGDREWRWPLYSLPQFGLRRIGLDRISPTRPEIFTVNTDCVLRGDRSSGLVLWRQITVPHDMQDCVRVRNHLECRVSTDVGTSGSWIRLASLEEITTQSNIVCSL